MDEPLMIAWEQTTPDAPKVCGNCKHYAPCNNNYGSCGAPVPAAYESYSGGYCSVIDEQAADCKLFTKN